MKAAINPALVASPASQDTPLEYSRESKARKQNVSGSLFQSLSRTSIFFFSSLPFCSPFVPFHPMSLVSWTGKYSELSIPVTLFRDSSSRSGGFLKPALIC